mgnify:CR=1 FL=1
MVRSAQLLLYQTRTYDHGADNRLNSVFEGSLEQGKYEYNALGQRVIKTANGKTQHFHYGLNGELLGEGDNDGIITREYVYLNGQMIAMITVDKVAAKPAAEARSSQDSEDPAIDASKNESTGSGGAFQWPLALVALLLLLLLLLLLAVIRRRFEMVVNILQCLKL